MKYIAPSYKLNEIEANDVITASIIQANNCTVINGVESTIQEGQTVTQVSGFFDSLVR